MNDPVMPTLEPLLIPEGATKRRKKKLKTPAVVIAKTEPEVPEPPEADEPKRYTLDEAFDYFRGPVGGGEDRIFNIERATRAVAFILQWASEMGNDDLNGRIAAGLGHVLAHVASEVARHPAPEIRYVAVGPAPKAEPKNPPEAS